MFIRATIQGEQVLLIVPINYLKKIFQLLLAMIGSQRKFEISLDLNSNSIVACIVEGKAETAVIELLLKNDLLLFKEDNLLSGELIKERKAEKFA